MLHILGAALAGVAFGEGIRRRNLRPLLKGAVKGWVRLTRETRKGTATLRSEAEKLVSEARAELNQQEGRE